MDAARTVALVDGTSLEEWRDRARELLRAEVRPEHVSWSADGTGELAFGPAHGGQARAAGTATQHRVPAEFLTLADRVLCLRDPQRHGLLYRILWRLTHGEPALLKILTDDDVLRAHDGEKSVRRDLHKMKAFVRFREVMVADREDAAATHSVFIAWFEPEHRIVTRVAPFFVRRFSGMHWSILTPDACVHWDGASLGFTPGVDKSSAPGGDALEDLWRTYYANIFNPARLKVAAMKSEMPMKYWKNLPEARLIPQLIEAAETRTRTMVAADPTTPRKRVAAPKPVAKPIAAGSLGALKDAARDCRACPLWEPATQTVFGEGPSDAEIVVIGEQPGDQEDLAGRPFIGPAGQLFDRALAEAGIDRARLYVTNTVKHFKFEPRGKRRIHSRANAQEQAACRPWLLGELDLIRPRSVLCLGGMAASAILGSGFKLLKERGQWRALEDGTRALATVHPSYLLRLPDESAKRAAYLEFVADLRKLNE